MLLAGCGSCSLLRDVDRVLSALLINKDCNTGLLIIYCLLIICLLLTPMEMTEKKDQMASKTSCSSVNSGSTSSRSVGHIFSSAGTKESSSSNGSASKLTEEQRKRIQMNREKALAIRKRRNEEEGVSEEEKKRKIELGFVELEPFEEGASEYVTKTDAMKLYCLPEGTLAVCEVVEKENPHNRKWKPMKLYLRSEIRKRARDRYGGMEGLVEERQKRQKSRYEKDREVAAKLFT